MTRFTSLALHTMQFANSVKPVLLLLAAGKHVGSIVSIASKHVGGGPILEELHLHRLTVNDAGALQVLIPWLTGKLTAQ